MTGIINAHNYLVRPIISFSSSNDWVHITMTRYPEQLVDYTRLDPNLGD